MSCQVKGCGRSEATAVTFETGRPDFVGPNANGDLFDPPISMEFKLCLHHAALLATGKAIGKVELTEAQVRELSRE